VWEQVRANIVAIVSVVVALGGLTYTTWRNEKTEANRSTRIAAFEVLKTLGELQLVVDYTYYRKDPARGDSTMGWRRAQSLKRFSVRSKVGLPRPDPCIGNNFCLLPV
jgi:hypothetical protein